MTKIDLIFLTLVCFLTFAYAWWAVSATRNYETLVLEKKQNAVQAKQDLRVAYSRLLELNRAQSRLKKDLKQLDCYLSPAQNKGALFQEIDTLIRASGLSLVSLQPGKTKNADGYQKKTLQIICKGEVIPIIELIQRLENMNAPLVLNQVCINPVKAEQQYRVLIRGVLIQLLKSSD